MCECACVCVFFFLSAFTSHESAKQVGTGGRGKEACIKFYCFLFMVPLQPHMGKIRSSNKTKTIMIMNFEANCYNESALLIYLIPTDGGVHI